MAKQVKAEVINAETKFNMTIGEKIYTLNFSTNTFLRIKAEKPELTTAFHAVEELAPYELLPFLIHCAIKPEQRGWSSFEEFADLYDEECNDSAAIEKVIPAFLSATGTVAKKIQPALDAVAKLQQGNEK